MANDKTIVLVGHCGPDMFMLKSAISRLAPEAPVATVNDSAGLEPYQQPGNVLLVNRVLDGQFGTESGVELIRQLSGQPDSPRALLVSNFEDAQIEAEEAGAMPGFGKSGLYDEETAQRLAASLA